MFDSSIRERTFQFFFQATHQELDKYVRGVIPQQSNEYAFFRKELLCVRTLLGTYGKQHVFDR